MGAIVLTLPELAVQVEAHRLGLTGVRLCGHSLRRRATAALRWWGAIQRVLAVTEGRSKERIGDGGVGRQVGARDLTGHSAGCDVGLLAEGRHGLDCEAQGNVYHWAPLWHM